MLIKAETRGLRLYTSIPLAKVVVEENAEANLTISALVNVNVIEIGGMASIDNSGSIRTIRGINVTSPPTVELSTVGTISNFSDFYNNAGSTQCSSPSDIQVNVTYTWDGSRWIH